MAPADKPEIVVAVIMDEPKVGARDGGMVSAPVFREIAQQILQEMKVAPDAAFKEESLIAKAIPETAKTVALASAKTGEKEKREKVIPGKSVMPPAGLHKPQAPRKTNEKPGLGKATARWGYKFDIGPGPSAVNTKFET
jgi:hypothetical protein